MKTPNGKFLSNIEGLVRIEGPLKYKEKPYPIPSKFYLNVIFYNHQYRFGYDSEKEAKEDKEFLNF